MTESPDATSREVNPYESPRVVSELASPTTPDRGSAVPLAILLIGFEVTLAYSLVNDAANGFRGTWFQVLSWVPRLALTLVMAAFSVRVIWGALRDRRR
jgi:hypothetical protein